VFHYAATKAGIAHFGEALRRELHGEGVHVLNVYPGATSTPMMSSSQAGPEHGFDYESPEEVAAAAVAGITDGSLTVVRGGQTRSRMIALNRDDPGAVDQLLAERKSELEQAVADHSSLRVSAADWPGGPPDPPDLSLLATTVLITGRWGAGGLYAGRLLTGVVSGRVVTVGTAWVKELSEGSPPGTGAPGRPRAHRGFGIGPLVAGLLAQWAPAPEVLPYVVHLALGGAAAALLPRARETRPPGAAPARRPRLLPVSAPSMRFRRVVLPLGPWVFGSVTLVFTTLPAHGVRSVGALGVAPRLRRPNRVERSPPRRPGSPW